jgi:hypothetical protein
MARGTAAEASEKWGRRLKGATADITKGIDRVTQAPGIAAAKQANVFAQKVAASVADGTWQKAVAGVSVEDWKKAAKEKGVARISAGVDGAATSHVAVMEKILQAVDASVAAVNQTPRGDLETNINRSATFQREMAKRKIRGK